MSLASDKARELLTASTEKQRRVGKISTPQNKQLLEDNRDFSAMVEQSRQAERDYYLNDYEMTQTDMVRDAKAGLVSVPFQFGQAWDAVQHIAGFDQREDFAANAVRQKEIDNMRSKFNQVASEDSLQRAEQRKMDWESKNPNPSNRDILEFQASEALEMGMDFFKNPGQMIQFIAEEAPDTLLAIGLAAPTFGASLFAKGGLTAAKRAGIKAAQEFAEKQVKDKGEDAMGTMSRQLAQQNIRNQAEGAANKRAALKAFGIESGLEGVRAGGGAGDAAYTTAYNEAIKQGRSEEESRALADEALNIAAPSTAALNLATAGAMRGLGGDIEGAIVNRLTGAEQAKNALLGIGKSAVGESIEEGIQSGGETVIGNYAQRETVSPEQSLIENVGRNVGTGMAAGGLIGGTFRGAGEVAPLAGAAAGLVGSAGRAVGGVASNLANRSNRAVEGAQGAIEEEAAAEMEAANDFFGEAVGRINNDESPVDFSDVDVTAEGGVDSALERADELIGMMGSDQATPDVKLKILESLENEIDALSAKEGISPEDKAKLITKTAQFEDLYDQLETEEDEFRSAESNQEEGSSGPVQYSVVGEKLDQGKELTPQEFQHVLNDEKARENLSEDQMNTFEAMGAFQSLAAEADSAKVANQIMNGDPEAGGVGARGIKGYESLVKSALNNSNPARARRHLNRFKIWVDQRADKEPMRVPSKQAEVERETEIMQKYYDTMNTMVTNAEKGSPTPTGTPVRPQTVEYGKPVFKAEGKGRAGANPIKRYFERVDVNSDKDSPYIKQGSFIVNNHTDGSGSNQIKKPAAKHGYEDKLLTIRVGDTEYRDGQKDFIPYDDNDLEQNKAKINEDLDQIEQRIQDNKALNKGKKGKDTHQVLFPQDEGITAQIAESSPETAQYINDEIMRRFNIRLPNGSEKTNKKGNNKKNETPETPPTSSGPTGFGSKPFDDAAAAIVEKGGTDSATKIALKKAGYSFEVVKDYKKKMAERKPTPEKDTTKNDENLAKKTSLDALKVMADSDLADVKSKVEKLISTKNPNYSEAVVQQAKTNIDQAIAEKNRDREEPEYDSVWEEYFDKINKAIERDDLAEMVALKKELDDAKAAGNDIVGNTNLQDDYMQLRDSIEANRRDGGEGARDFTNENVYYLEDLLDAVIELGSLENPTAEQQQEIASLHANFNKKDSSGNFNPKTWESYEIAKDLARIESLSQFLAPTHFLQPTITELHDALSGKSGLSEEQQAINAGIAALTDDNLQETFDTLGEKEERTPVEEAIWQEAGERLFTREAENLSKIAADALESLNRDELAKAKEMLENSAEFYGLSDQLDIIESALDSLDNPKVENPYIGMADEQLYQILDMLNNIPPWDLNTTGERFLIYDALGWNTVRNMGIKTKSDQEVIDILFKPEFHGEQVELFSEPKEIDSAASEKAHKERVEAYQASINPVTRDLGIREGTGDSALWKDGLKGISTTGMNKATIAIIQKLQRNRDAFAKQVHSMIPEGKSKYNYVTYLTDENGQLPDAVIDSMMIAVAEWLGSTAASNVEQTTDGMKKILGIDKHTHTTFSQETSRTLKPIGSAEQEVHANIGQAIFNSLGLKMKGPDARVNTADYLATDLAAAAIVAFSQTEIDGQTDEIKRLTTPALDIQKAYARDVEGFDWDAEETTDEQRAKVEEKFKGDIISYIPTRQVVDGKTELGGLAQFLDEQYALSDNGLGVAFGTGAINKMPQVGGEPIASPQFTQGSRRKLSPERLQNQNNFNSHKFWLKDHMTNLLNDDAVEGFEQFLGVITQDELDSLPEFAKDTAAGSNTTVGLGVRNLNQLFKAIQEKTEKHFYFSLEVNKIGRNQYSQSKANPTADKVARGMMYTDSMKSTVTFDKDGNPTDSRRYLDYILAQGEAFGIEAEKKGVQVAVDKTVAKIQDILNDPDMQSILNNALAKPTTNNMTKLANKFDQLGLKRTTMSLDGLVQLYRVEDAKANGTNADYYMQREFDGKTNGPFMSQLEFGLGDQASIDEVAKNLSSGFFFSDGDIETTDDPGGIGNITDMYQRPAQKGIDMINDPEQEFSNGSTGKDGIRLVGNATTQGTVNRMVIDRVNAILGLGLDEEVSDASNIFGGIRDLFKYPVNKTNYGAGARAVKIDSWKAVEGAIQKELQSIVKQDMTVGDNLEKAAKYLHMLNDLSEGRLFSTDKSRGMLSSTAYLPPLEKIDAASMNRLKNAIKASRVITTDVWLNERKLTADQVAQGNMKGYIKDKDGNMVQVSTDRLTKDPFKYNLRTTIEGVLGSAMQVAVSGEVSNVKETTGAIVAATNAQVSMYKNMLNELERKYKKARYLRGEVGSIDEASLTQSEVRKIKKELEVAFPAMDTAIGDQKAISFIKMEKDYDSRANTVTQFKKGSVRKWEANEEGELVSDTINGSNRGIINRVISNPGVLGAPASILSLDGAIMAHMFEHEKDFMQYFDAIGVSPDSEISDDQIFQMNKILAERMMNNSQYMNVMNTVESTWNHFNNGVNGIKQYMTKPDKDVRNHRTQFENLDRMLSSVGSRENYNVLDEFFNGIMMAQPEGWGGTPPQVKEAYMALTHEMNDLRGKAVSAKQMEQVLDMLTDAIDRTDTEIQTQVKRAKEMHEKKQELLKKHQPVIMHYYKAGVAAKIDKDGNISKVDFTNAPTIQIPALVANAKGTLEDNEEEGSLFEVDSAVYIQTVPWTAAFKKEGTILASEAGLPTSALLNDDGTPKPLFRPRKYLSEMFKTRFNIPLEEMLTVVKNKTTDKNRKMLDQALIDLTKKLQEKSGVNIKVMKMPKHERKGYLHGLAKDGTIKLDEDIGMNPTTLRHEAVHTTIGTFLWTLEESGGDKALLQKWYTLYKHATGVDISQIADKADRQYKMNEFIAEAFTDSNTQAYLMSISPSQAKTKTLWDQLVSLVKSALGLPDFGVNALTETMQLVRESEAAFDYDRLTNEFFYLDKVTGPAQQQQSSQSQSHEHVIRANQANPKQVFQALTDLAQNEPSAEHQAVLKENLSQIDDSILQKLDVHLMATGGANKVDVENSTKLAIYNTNNPSLSLENDLEVWSYDASPQELYLQGATQIAAEETIKHDPAFARQLSRVYNRMEKLLDKQDAYKYFLDDPTDTSDEAVHDAHLKMASFLRITATTTPMKNEVGIHYASTKSNYLRNFFSLAVSNDKFRKMLQKLDDLSKEGKQKNQTFLEQVSQAWDKMLDFWFNLGNKSLNTSSNLELMDKLAARLTGNELKNRSKLEKHWHRAAKLATEVLGAPVGKISNVVNKSAKKLYEAGGKGVKHTAVNLTILATNTTEQNGLLHKELDFVQKKMREGKQGFAKSLWNELKNPDKVASAYHNMTRLTNRMVEALRKTTADSMTKSLIDNYKQGTLNKQNRISLGKFLRTDAATIFEQGFTSKQIESLLRDPAKVDREVAKIADKLKQSHSVGEVNFYQRASNNLAHFMIHSTTVEDGNLMLNAGQIAAGMGTSKPVAHSEEDIKDIDLMVSLMSLNKLSPQVKDDVRSLIASERARTDLDNAEQANGLTHMLSVQRVVKESSIQYLFGGDATHIGYTKGYLADKTNPDKSVRVANEDAAEDLKKQGFKKAEKIGKDTNGKDLHIFTGHGNSSYMQGLMSISNFVAKGHKVGRDRHLDVNGNWMTVERESRKATKAATDRWFNSPTPSNAGAKARPVPIYGWDGDQPYIKEYREMLTEEQKKRHQDKVEDFASVLGYTAGTIVDKESSRIVNQEVMDVLHETYENASPLEKRGFLKLNKTSTDKELREKWAQIPEETRQYWFEKTGTTEIPVRSDLLTLVTGQRKLSLQGLWDQENEDLNAASKVFKHLMATLFGNDIKARNVVANTGKGWTELVSTVKDIVVVKSGAISAANAISNTVFLTAVGGMSPIKAARLQIQGIDEARRYQKMTNERAQLRLEMANSISDKKKAQIHRKIDKLSSLMSMSPVHDLIEGGVLGNVVEDISMDVDEFSFKNAIADKVEGKMDWVPHKVRDAAKFAYMSQDSSSYKFMNDAVRYSDFGARYAYVTHKQSLKNNKKSREKLVEEAMDMFVNYDRPTHSILQYGNDMGLIWFSKYYLQIQHVIYNYFKEKPASAIAWATGQQLFGDAPDITDSFMLFNSPLNMFGFTDRLTSGATLHPGIQLTGG